MNLPFIISLLLPALKTLNPENFVFSYGFVGTLTGLVSLLNGVGQGMSQPASGNYVSDCANERVKGFYFAFFWAFYMGSQTIGMIIAAFTLSKLEPYTFPLIMIVILSFGILFLLLLKKPIILIERHGKGSLLEEDAIKEKEEDDDILLRYSSIKKNNNEPDVQ